MLELCRRVWTFETPLRGLRGLSACLRGLVSGLCLRGLRSETCRRGDVATMDISVLERLPFMVGEWMNMCASRGLTRERRSCALSMTDCVACWGWRVDVRNSRGLVTKLHRISLALILSRGAMGGS